MKNLVCDKGIPKRIDCFDISIPEATRYKMLKLWLNCGDEFFYRGAWWVVTRDHLNGMIDIDEILERDLQNNPKVFGNSRRCIYKDEI